MGHYVRAALITDSGRKLEGAHVVTPYGFETEADRFAKNLVRFLAEGLVWRNGRDVEFWTPSAYGSVEGSVPVFESISEALDAAIKAGWRGHKRERGSVVYDPLTRTLETSTGPRLIGFFSVETYPVLQLTFRESERRLRIEFDAPGHRATFRLEGLNAPELGHFERCGNSWARKWPAPGGAL